MTRTTRKRTRDSILNRHSKFDQLQTSESDPNFADNDAFKAWLLKLSYMTPQKREESIQKSPWRKHLKLTHFNNPEFFALNAGNQLFNVHRGSSNIEDFALTDVALAFNNLESTDRYKRSALWSKEATEQYGKGQRVTHVGHSLGGTLAEKISSEQGTESHAYNQGTNPFASYDNIDRSKHKHTQVKGDVISSFDNSEGTSTITPKSEGTVASAFPKADQKLLGGHFGLGELLLKLLHSHSTDRVTEQHPEIENKP